MKLKVIALLALSLAPLAAFAQPHFTQSGGGYHGGPAHGGLSHGGPSHGGVSHVGGGYRPGGPAVNRGHVGGRVGGVVASSHSGWRPPLRPGYGRPYYAGHYGHSYYPRYYGYPRYGYSYGGRPYYGYGGFYAGLAIGTFVATLPYAYDTFWYGGIPYYYYDNTYYRWNRGVDQYEVVDRPSNTAPPSEDSSGAAPKDIFVYPTKGQSEEQQNTDRYECHRWAVDKTGFDPTSGVPAQEGENDQYRRAESACLTGRGYSVK